MTQGMPNRGVVLAARSELWPHRGDRIVESEPTSVDELQRQQRHEGFPHRVEVDQRVGLPGSFTGLVRPTADEVDDDLAVDDHTDPCTDFATFHEVARELLVHRSERCITTPTRRARAWNGHRNSLQRQPPRVVTAGVRRSRPALGR